MFPTVAMHSVKNVRATTPSVYERSEEDGGTFWTATLVFTGEDGKLFSLPIFGKTEESVTMNVG